MTNKFLWTVIVCLFTLLSLNVAKNAQSSRLSHSLGKRPPMKSPRERLHQQQHRDQHHQHHQHHNPTLNNPQLQISHNSKVDNNINNNNKFTKKFGNLTRGTVYYVNSASSPNGNGLSWNTAFNNLQSALTTATAGDQIWVAQGTYCPASKSSDVEQSFIISQSEIYLYGGFKGDETSIDQRIIGEYPTILSGQIGDANVYHVVKIIGAYVEMDGFTIQDGYAPGANDGGQGCSDCFGGGIYIKNPQSTALSDNITNINITDKSPIPGHTTYYIKLYYITFYNNKAIQGGAIFAYCYVDLTIDNCEFNYNSAFQGKVHIGGGGALFMSYHATAIISSTTFTGNTAIYRGGAIYIDYGVDLTVTDSTFVSNQVTTGNGGAIYVTDRCSNDDLTTLVVRSCGFHSNTAGGSGGALFSYYGTITSVIYSTFDDNIAGGKGGALGFYDAKCFSCCGYTSNTFLNNAASISDNDCFEDTFPYFGETEKISIFTPYIDRLYNNYDPTKEPSELSNKIYVDGTKQQPGDGLSWATAFNDIQFGINAAQQMGSTTTEVWVRGGNVIYYPSTVPSWYNTSAWWYDAERSKMIDVSAFIHIYGGFAGNETKRSQRNFKNFPTQISGKLNSEQKGVYQVVRLSTQSYMDGFIITDGESLVTQSNGILPPSNNTNITTKLNYYNNNKIYQSIPANYKHWEDLNLPTKYNLKHNSYIPDIDPYNHRIWNKIHFNSLGLGSSTDPTSVLHNKVPNCGGGIYVNSSSFISNILIANNYAQKGGGLYILDHVLTGINVGFVSNFGEYRGGGVSVDMHGTLKCDTCFYELNGSGRKGGGIYLDYSANSQQYNTYFNNNKAYDSGGGIANDGAGTSIFGDGNVLLENNWAFMEGAALYQGSYSAFGPKDNIFQLQTGTEFEFNGNSCDFGPTDEFYWNFDYSQTNVPTSSN